MVALDCFLLGVCEINHLTPTVTISVQL